MTTDWYAHLLWIAAAGVLGWSVAFVFASRLHLRRNTFLFPYIVLAGLLVTGYAQWSQLKLTDFILYNWLGGLLGAIALGVFLVKNILSQATSAHSTGIQFGLDLVWQGVVYGAADALLLSVLPILATWQAFSMLGWTATFLGTVLVGLLALLSSLLVTFAYHRGYPEYRGKRVTAPLVGNGLMSLGYLITTNPIAAVGSHIAMHIAGVVHGPETTAQLPPHY